MSEPSSLVIGPPSTAKISSGEISVGVAVGPLQAATIQARAKNTKDTLIEGKDVRMSQIVSEHGFEAQLRITPDVEGTTVAYLNLP